MKHIATLLFALCSLAAMAQPNAQDVVYLKNGGIIKGKILTPKSGELQATDPVRIEIAGGSVFVFQRNDIDSVKRENMLKRQIERIKKDYFRRNRGYRNMTELGVHYGPGIKKDNDGYPYNNTPRDDLGLSLHTINGYQWWPYLYTAAGLGIDRYNAVQHTFSPFYLRLASEFLKSKVTPYVFTDVGYAVMWKRKGDDFITYKNKGGLYINAGAGVRIYTRSRASVIFSAAYRRTNSETKYWYNGFESTYYTTKRAYQRMVVSVGVTF